MLRRTIRHTASAASVGRAGAPPPLPSRVIDNSYEFGPRWPPACRPRIALQLNGRIFLNVVLPIRSVVGASPAREIHLVADDPCLPGRHEELRKGAFPRLVGSQGHDEGIAVERGHVGQAGDERRTLHHDRTVRGEKQTLASR
jgi:hypothetical protein